MIDLASGEAKGYVRAICLCPVLGEKTHCMVILEGQDGLCRSFDVPLWSEPMYRVLKGEFVTIDHNILQAGARDADQDRSSEAGLGDGEEVEASHTRDIS